MVTILVLNPIVPNLIFRSDDCAIRIELAMVSQHSLTYVKRRVHKTLGFAAKNPMLARAHNNVEVARAAAATAGVAFARQADALAVARPRLDAHRHRLLPRHHAFAAAEVTNCALLAAAAAARASDVEL